MDSCQSCAEGDLGKEQKSLFYCTHVVISNIAPVVASGMTGKCTVREIRMPVGHALAA